ncbi:Hsp70 family chaperone [Apiospora rasikravindrae]|uniref:Hsp70 family chaperone n=1 Tax=Apiospora rasikravindrae TaxID=990691 RepID=A0ABR1SPJ3_9PEZI
MNSPDIIVSIDLGTTYTGVAWTTPRRPIDVIHNWPGTGDGSEKKVPTILLYPNGQTTPSSWGHSCLYNESSDLTRREFFKIFLDHETLESTKHQGFTAVLETTVEARRIVTDFLRYIYAHTKETIEREMARLHRGGWRDLAVEFLFSVPTTWTNQGIINDFKQAIRDAGYGTEGPRHSAAVDLTEAEAAAVATLKYSPADFVPGDVFMCIDAGGGTTDLALMQVTSVDANFPQMKQIAEVQGTGVGASQVDRLFARLVSQRLSAFPAVQAQLPQNLAARMARSPYFKMMKYTFGQRAFMDLPRHYVQMEGVSCDFSHVEAGIDQGRMIFTIGEFESLFDPAVQGIVSRVTEQLNWLHRRGRAEQVKYFVLSGGLGSNKYVQNKLQRHFESCEHPNAGRVAILCAQEPQLVVVRGLLEDRKQRIETGSISVLASRIARVSYGVVVKQVYSPVHHFDADVEEDQFDKNTKFALNQIQWLIRKGDTVTPGEPLIKTLHIRLAADDTTRAWDTQFVVSHNEPTFLPASLKHAGAIRLCEVKSNLTGVEQHQLAMKHKRGTCFRAGYKFYICEFDIRAIVAPADLRFELWFGGTKFSSDHEPITVTWDEVGARAKG